MVQAAVEGSIDFRSADPQDSRWWTRTLWITSELARGRHLRYLEQSASHRRALMSNAGFEPDDWSNIRDQATETLNRIYGNLFPWAADSDASGTSQQEAERLAKMWEERWGNPSDPAVAAEIDELVAAIEYRAPPPDDDEDY